MPSKPSSSKSAPMLVSRRGGGEGAVLACLFKMNQCFICSDDQLSDYVMIMITNKKTEKQMTDDLELFLGGIQQSASFSAWYAAF